MKVKITKHQTDNAWYVNHIGSTYEVNKYNNTHYEVINNTERNGHYINKEDCVIIEGEVELYKQQSIELKINKYNDRMELIKALVNNGYTVKAEERQKDSWNKYDIDYYVIIS